MKRSFSIAFVLALLVAAPLSAESVDGVLMDVMCSGKFAAKGYDGSLPHTKMCALMDNCKASGFVIIQKDGKVVKLDANGNELAIKALEATSKNDTLTVAAEGKLDGDTLAVSSLKIT